MSADMKRIEQLVQEVEALPGASREKARELLRAVLALHAGALEKVAARVGAPALEALAEDEQVEAVLLLHGLHPLGLEARVRRGLDRARPQLRAHGGDVELVSLSDEGVRLRLVGACDGCPSSALTLRGLIEDAVLASAPDAPALVVEGAAARAPDVAAPALVCGR
jgi:Fe-S cluster biogenesis protein NfuA